MSIKVGGNGGPQFQGQPSGASIQGAGAPAARTLSYASSLGKARDAHTRELGQAFASGTANGNHVDSLLSGMFGRR